MKKEPSLLALLSQPRAPKRPQAPPKRRPIKQKLPPVKQIEAKVEKKLRKQFDIPERTKQGTFKFTQKQEEAIALLCGPQKHTMLYGGSRSGKTFLLVRTVVARATKTKGLFSRHVVFRMRANACRQTVWMDTFNKVVKLCFPGLRVEKRLMDGYVVLPDYDNTEIWFAGLDDKERVEKILGMEFATEYFNECSQIPYASVETALTRLAQKVEGLQARAYYDLNPTTHKHWTYMLFERHLHPINRMPLDNPADYQRMQLNPVDNTGNIAQDYVKSLQGMSARARKRFFDGEYLTEVENALWTEELLERTRVDLLPADPQRVVIAVDPSGAKGEEDARSDEIGITVAGKIDNQAFILKDATLKGKPEVWARRVVSLYFDCGADCVVAEKNYGGDMVRSVIHGVNENVKVKLVSATRGKVVRAEPVSALYDQNRVHHVGGEFKELEDELQAFSVDEYKGDRSPNRADALVWAVTELLLGESTSGAYNFLRDTYQETQSERPNRVPGTQVVVPKTSFDVQKFLEEMQKQKDEALSAANSRRDPLRAW